VESVSAPLVRALGSRSASLASALAGDREALLDLLRCERAADLLVADRLAPALAVRCAELGLEGPNLQSWKRQLYASAGIETVFEGIVHRLGETLGQAGIAWAPVKGMGLIGTVYRSPGERPTGDVDILVSASNLEAAVAALARDGWQSVAEGELAWRYLHAEGYAWQATRSEGVLLELHFRLWGSVPEALGEAVLARAFPDPALGPTARRLRLADAYVLAAVHTWLTPAPRPLVCWWDLQRIVEAGNADLADTVIEQARTWGLELFVGPCAAIAAGLWGHETNHRVAGLLEELRAPEAVALRLVRHLGPDRVPLGALILARLLAGRPSRAGWRSVYRQVWAHPGVVAMSTPGSWGWPARRLTHVLRCVKLGLLARALGALLPSPAPGGGGSHAEARIQASVAAPVLDGPGQHPGTDAKQEVERSEQSKHDVAEF